MNRQEMINQANEIMKIRESYEKWIGGQIQNYCNQNGLDYNNAKDYSMAAIKLQKTTRPLSPYDAGLLYRILDCQKTDETSSPTIDSDNASPHFSDEDRNTLKSMYGEWKELERGFKNILHNPNALKNQRHEIEREVKETRDELTRDAVLIGVSVAKGKLLGAIHDAREVYFENKRLGRPLQEAEAAGLTSFQDKYESMKAWITKFKADKNTKELIGNLDRILYQKTPFIPKLSALESIIKSYKW